MSFGYDRRCRSLGSLTVAVQAIEVQVGHKGKHMI